MLYEADGKLYEGVLSDIEEFLAIDSRYGYTPAIREAEIVRVTPDAVARVRELSEQIIAKRQELKNLISSLDLVFVQEYAKK